jgi:hypothetical protein
MNFPIPEAFLYIEPVMVGLAVVAAFCAGWIARALCV